MLVFHSDNIKSTFGFWILYSKVLHHQVNRSDKNTRTSLPGYLSPSMGLKFADVPNGLAAITKVDFVIIGYHWCDWTEWLTWIVQVVRISTDLNCHLVGKLVNQHFFLYEINILLGKLLNYIYTKQILFFRKASHFCPYPQLQGDVILHRQVPGNGWAQIVAFAGYYELFVYKFNGTPGATERYVLFGFDHEYCDMYVSGEDVCFFCEYFYMQMKTQEVKQWLKVEESCKVDVKWIYPIW